MLGIPLFLMLFGQENVYRMATLDVAQILVAVPTISILSMRAEEQVSLKGIIRKIITSPYLIAALLGMAQGNVARTLQRAKEKLRKALKDEGVEV